MLIIDIVCIAFGVICLAFAYKFYLELWKWARMCQRARIAVAYKRKVKMQAPLIEWLQWINSLEADEASTGRVIYTIGGTSIAITRSGKTSPRRELWQYMTRALRRQQVTTAPQAPMVREGTWTAKDDTKH